ncbi:hypothetical protein PT2222_80078 [Paraburkholderia tropica]
MSGKETAMRRSAGTKARRASDDRRDAGLAHVADHHRIHGLDVKREPLAQFADQPSAEVEARVLRDLVAHEAGDVQRVAMLARVAMTRPEFERLHPALFLRKMLARVRDPHVERADERRVRCIVREVEQAHEFGVHGVGDGLAELQLGRQKRGRRRDGRGHEAGRSEHNGCLGEIIKIATLRGSLDDLAQGGGLPGLRQMGSRDCGESMGTFLGATLRAAHAIQLDPAM